MWKKGMWLVVMSSALVFVSCDSPPTTPTPSEPPLTQQPTQQQPKTPTEQAPAKSSGLTYEVTTVAYADQGVAITYPQIETDDLTKQNQLNKLIKSEALKAVDLYQDTGNLSLAIESEVKWQGAHLLSIQYSGVGNVQGAAHPNLLLYTTNINLDTGEMVQIQDILKLDSKLLDTFKTGKWKTVRPEHEGLDLLHIETVADLTKSDTHIYFTKNALGISIGVPYAVGGHSEFEINYRDLAGSMNKNHSIWIDFQ